MSAPIDRAWVEILPSFVGFSEQVKAGVAKGFAGVGPTVAAEGRKSGLEYEAGVASGMKAGGAKAAAASWEMNAAANAKAAGAAGAKSGESFAKRFITGLGGAKMFGGVALAAGVIAAIGVKMAGDFQASMVRLVTSAGEVPKNLKMVSDGVLAIARSTGTSVKALGDSAYMIESAGFHGQKALDVLKAAAQGAKVDMADAAVVGDALTTAMVDLGKGAGPPALVMSQLIATVGRGKMTMDNLAGSLHSVLPNAVGLGLGIAQVGAAIATMTAQGVSADQTTQNLNHVILSLANPTSIMTKTMAAFGLSSTDVSSKLGQRGLTGTLQILEQAIIAKMGPAGLTLTAAFNSSTIAAGKANTAYAAMPKWLQQVATAIKTGEAPSKALAASHQTITLQDKALIQQWTVLQKHASGFADLLKSGSPTALTYAAAMAKMTGGQQGLQVALHLSGDNMTTFQANVKAISAASVEAGGNVEGWRMKQQTFNQKMSELKQIVATAVLTLGKDLLPVLTVIATFLINDVVPAIRDLFNAFKATFEFIARNKDTIGIIAGAITLLLLPAILSAIAAMATWVSAQVIGYATIAAGAVTSAATQVGAWVATSVAGFGAVASFIADVAVVVAGWVVMGVQSLLAAAKVAAAWLIAMGPIGWVIAAVIAIVTLIVLNWNTVWKWTKKIWNDVVDVVKTVWNWIKAAIQEAIKIIIIALLVLVLWPVILYQHWSQIVTFVVRIWNDVIKFVEGIPAKLLKVGKMLWNFVLDQLKFEWNIVLAVWSGAIKFVTSIPGALARGASKIWNWIVDLLKASWKNVTNIWDGAVSFVKGLPSKIASAARGLWDGIVGAAKSAFNAIADLWNNTVGSLSFKMPGWIPFIGGDKFSMPQIPRLAYGGMTQGPGYIFTGDNPSGKELIAPMDSPATVTLLANAMNKANAMMKRSKDTAHNFEAHTSGGGQLAALIDALLAFASRPVELKANGVTLAQVVQDSSRVLARRS